VRVLWVGHNLAYPPVRGVLLRNYNLLREAAKKSEVHVLAFDQPRARPPGVSAEDCIDALRKFCTHVEWLPLPSGGSKSPYWLGLRGLLSRNAYDLNWFASDSMAFRLQSTLDRVKFDTIHFDTLGLAQYRPLVSGAGTVLNHHNIESSMMKHRAETDTRRIPRQYWRWEAQKLLRAERDYCPQFSVNLVVSPEDGETLARHAPGITTRVVANGVDTEYFTPRADPGGNTLLFCGGLDWYPNGDAMVYFFDQIWPLLTRQIPHVRMIVVGRNPPRWLTQLSDTDRRIQVTGFVDDVRPYFKEATAYICPIRAGGGTRLKILDALAMGMPLVGTTFACSGISVQHEKHVLLADTPAAFSEQVLRTLADPVLRANLAAQGRDLVCKDYSWSVVGKSLLLAYEEAALSAGRKPQPLLR
jgi:glycosyltransferase involved in cell wall biosynthesis